MSVDVEIGSEGAQQRRNYDLLAATYDRWYVSSEREVLRTAEYLASLVAGMGRFLEVGIGTGRVAIPLMKLGHTVHGVEVSPEMVKVLSSKLPENDARVWVADFASFSWKGVPYDVVYIVGNSIYHATTMDDLARWLSNAASMLKRGGSLVVETYVGGLPERMPHLAVEAVSDGEVVLKVTDLDRATKVCRQVLVSIAQDSVRSFPQAFRAHSLQEIDLVAVRHGFSLHRRGSAWHERGVLDNSTGTGWSVAEYTRV